MFPVRAVLLERGQVYVSGVLTHSPSRRVFRRTFARSARPLVVEAEGRTEAPDAVARLAVEGVDFHEHNCAGERVELKRVASMARRSFDDSRDADTDDASASRP